MTGWLWNVAGRWTFRLGEHLYAIGLSLCGLAGYLGARADQAGYWTAARSERLRERAGAS